MCAGSDFDDTVKICEFYSGDGLPIRVDYENLLVYLGDYIVDPVMGSDHISYYLVVEPDGRALFVNDLDSYFQGVLGLEDC